MHMYILRSTSTSHHPPFVPSSSMCADQPQPQPPPTRPHRRASPQTQAASSEQQPLPCYCLLRAWRWPPSPSGLRGATWLGGLWSRHPPLGLCFRDPLLAALLLLLLLLDMERPRRDLPSEWMRRQVTLSGLSSACRRRNSRFLVSLGVEVGEMLASNLSLGFSLCVSPSVCVCVRVCILKYIIW